MSRKPRKVSEEAVVKAATPPDSETQAISDAIDKVSNTGRIIPNSSSPEMRLLTRIMEISLSDLQSLNVEDEYERVKNSLSLGDKATKPSDLLKALDTCCGDANIASRLSIMSSYTANLRKLELSVDRARIEARAEVALMEEKNDGKWTGQMSEPRIRRYIINHSQMREILFSIEEEEECLSAMTATMKALAENTKEHKGILQTQTNLLDRMITPKGKGHDDA